MLNYFRFSIGDFRLADFEKSKIQNRKSKIHFHSAARCTCQYSSSTA